MNVNIETEVALLKKNDSIIDQKVDELKSNQQQHMINSSEHEKKDQDRHLEALKANTELKELILIKMNSIEKYVDLKIKESALLIDKEYTKKIEHKNLENNIVKMEIRVLKIESIFSWV